MPRIVLQVTIGNDAVSSLPLKAELSLALFETLSLSSSVKTRSLGEQVFVSGDLLLGWCFDFIVISPWRFSFIYAPL
jgi:hypothetical protein